VSKELRPYQEQAINAIETDLSNGINRLLLVMSMGLGKTFTAVKAEEKLKSKKTIWVTDDERLLEQSALAFISDKFDKRFADHVEKEGFINYCKQGGVFANSGYRMSVIKADMCDTSGDIVFASAQTLWRRTHLLDPDLFDVMIIDEAHCFGAKRIYEGISAFNTRLRLGLTGTPFRNDGMLMGDMFDRISFEYGMKEGIENGYLCELDAVRIKTTTNLDKVHTSAGDFKKDELANEVNNPARNYLVAESYLKYANGRQAIGYGVDIAHCIDLAEAFRQKGINAVAISSDDERTGDKNIYIKAYKEKKIDVIFNVNLMSKGFDHPDTGCTIAAAPTKSLVRYLQGPAGRGSRLKSPEYVKKFGQNAIILDIVDSTSRHNLVNAWELDREKPPEERTFITAEKREKLLDERAKKSAKLEHERKEDEKVSLLRIPKFKISNSIKMTEEATEAQLRWVYDLGYPQDVHYTKKMCSEIISQQPATAKQIALLKHHNYDVTNKVITIGDVNAAMWEVKQKLNKTK